MQGGTEKKKAWLLMAIAGVSMTAIISLGPISQDPGYHAFADQRVWAGVPNALNVLSNLPFVLVGFLGAFYLLTLIRKKHDAVLPAYLLFFLAVAVTGFGSFYYHYNPTNKTLIWDRLPMTVAFMSFFSSIVSERINRKVGRTLLVPLLVLGLGSVLYWAMGDRSGHGDLRAYAAVQFIPLILMPLILLLYPSNRSYWLPVASLLACYAAAKVCEVLDEQIYAFHSLVSGHTLKHLFAALGAWFILKMVYDREKEFEDKEARPEG